MLIVVYFPFLQNYFLTKLKTYLFLDPTDSSDEMPEPLTPQKPDPTAAFQFLFAANQLVTEKKRRRIKCPSLEGSYF